MLENKTGRLSPVFIRLFLPFGLGYFLSVIVGSVNAMMSPILISEFSLSPADLGFMSSVYLIVFGLSQFPVGIFLDRFGARKTLAPFLIFAAAGALIYGIAHGFGALVLSRALVGIGFAGSLMAAFKAFATLLPQEKLPVAYSALSLMGGLGGMCATRPVAMAFDTIGWRPVFFLLAAGTLAYSAAIWFAVPKDGPEGGAGGTTLARMLREMLALFADKGFLCASAPAMAGQGVYFAYLFLWIGPWMYDVAAFGEASAGTFMMLAFASAAAGFFMNGVIAEWLEERGLLSWEQFYLISDIFIAVFLAVIAAMNSASAASLWSPVMFFSAMTMISFPIVRRMYAGGEVGRAFALLNFLIFLISFFIQWFIGLLLNLYPVTDGHFSPAGHSVCLYALSLLNFACCAWFAYGMKRGWLHRR